MANATVEETESNDSPQRNVAALEQPPPPLPQETESQQSTSEVVKIKKERKADTPPVPAPPPIQSTPVSTTIPSGSQDEQLRLLLQQTPSSNSTSPASIITTTSTSSAQSHSYPSRSSVNGTQRTIDSYFGKNVTETKQDDERKTPPLDLESVRGMFGWTTLEGVHIPFILRGQDKFTAVRIIEKTLLKKFLQALPPDVYSCTYIKSYFITENEAKLLNDINNKHCDQQYGIELFSTKDLVVLLNDVEQLYQFLSTCYYKLTRPNSSGGSSNKTGKCGIVKIGGRAIPYVLRNDVRYVPLILFDHGSAVKALDMKAEKLESWEMSYVKFCCKVAGISYDFLQQDSCLVVSIDDLQQTLGARFSFEEWWPSASPALSKSSSNVNQQLHQQQVLQSKTEKDSKYSAVHQRVMKNEAQNNGQRCTRNSSQQSPFLGALPASGWYDPTSGVFTSAVQGPISSSREQSEGRNQASSNSRSVTNQNVNGNQNCSRAVPSTASVPSYSIPELLPNAFQMAPTLPFSKLQAFLYSGQYWGSSPYLQDAQSSQMPMVYPTTIEPAYAGRTEQIADHRRIDSSLNGRNSSNLIQINPGRLPSKSSYTLPNVPNTQVASAMMLPPNLLQVSSDMLNRDHHKDPKAQDEQRSPFYPDGQYRGLPKVTSSEHTVARSILNGSRDYSMMSSTNATKHLLGMNRASPRLENFVVAPGNVQSLAGKMSSPKPANQVPAHVSNYHNYRIPGQLDASKTVGSSNSASSTTAIAASRPVLRGREVNYSKLHQLLSTTQVEYGALEPQDLSVGNRNSAQSSSKSRRNVSASHLEADGYQVQHLNVLGIKFRAIVTVMSHSKGPPMIPLSELERRITPRVQADYYEQILTQGFGVRLHSCSRGQAEILKKYVHCSIEDKSLLLICGDDLKRCLPNLQQITCTMTKLRTSPHLGDGVSSKRLRLETEAVT